MSIKFIGVGGPGQIGNMGKTQKTQADSKTEGKGDTDKVQFSSVLQDVHKAQSAKGISDTARSEQVQAIKAQIAEGSYQPDLNKVSTSLLQFMFNGK
jgi:negative regulator of flagellin synthesis FlgM